MSRRPWNLVDTQIYSLLTKVGEEENMNICTYVSAVSMVPKRYMVAVYHNTKTKANLENSDYCVLQFLAQQQFNLVNALGKKSGSKYNKMQYLTKKNLLDQWLGYSVLAEANAYLLLKKINNYNAGDHDIYLFDVVKYKTNSQQLLLTTNYLIEKKVILS